MVEYVTFLPDFCKSKFTEIEDRERDFSRKFLRVENENESSEEKRELIIDMRLLNLQECGSD